MLPAHAHRLFDIRPTRIFETGVSQDHAHRGDVEEGEDARLGAVDDVSAKRWERTRAGRPCIHNRRNPASYVYGVGVNSVARRAPKVVRVEVYEPGRDDHASGVHDFGSMVGGDVRLDERDLPVCQSHVAHVVDALRGVDDAPARYYQVVSMCHGARVCRFVRS